MKKGEFHNADVVIKINLLYEIFVNAPREFPSNREYKNVSDSYLCKNNSWNDNLCQTLWNWF